MRRARIDQLLVERGLVESRERARRLVLAGEVLVEDRPVAKPGAQVPADAQLRLRGREPYVSRGGVKLAAALDAFGLAVEGSVALDVGASTGGFTDCLLARGARRVVAVDVGYGQLAWKLRSDPRVRCLERTNIRTLNPERLGEKPDIVVIDVSFISLRLVLPAVARLIEPGARVVALVKPQFEVGRERVGKGGVVRNPEWQAEAVRMVVAAAQAVGFEPRGKAPSVLLGPKGNREVFVYLVYTAAGRHRDLCPPGAGGGFS